jgi:hypothetical protein
LECRDEGVADKNHCNAPGVGQVEEIAHFFQLLILNKKKK